jgi:enoyl-[acyl-carrier-protein] reductase (NADH)
MKPLRSSRCPAGRTEAPVHSLVNIDDVGVATAFIPPAAPRVMTGETLYLDGGYPMMGLGSS